MAAAAARAAAAAAAADTAETDAKAAAALAGTKRVEGPKYCIGIDPGSVNMGVAVWDRHLQKCVRLMRVELRPSGTGGNDIGGASLSLACAAWMTKEDDLFSNSFVFIEEQPPEAVREIVRVQDFVQHGCTMIGVQCKAVNAAAYKARFHTHFTKHPEYETFAPHRKKINQKNWDRARACQNGRRAIDSAVTEKYEDEAKDAEKIDDAYEAFYIAWYGEVALVNEAGTGLLATPRPAPTIKPSDDIQHQRGRVTQTKARAKWLARQKAKAATARSNAASPASSSSAAAAAAAAAAAGAGAAAEPPTNEPIDLTNISVPVAKNKAKRKRPVAKASETKKARTE